MFHKVLVVLNLQWYTGEMIWETKGRFLLFSGDIVEVNHLESFMLPIRLAYLLRSYMITFAACFQSTDTREAVISSKETENYEPVITWIGPKCIKSPTATRKWLMLYDWTFLKTPIEKHKDIGIFVKTQF